MKRPRLEGAIAAGAYAPTRSGAFAARVDLIRTRYGSARLAMPARYGSQ